MDIASHICEAEKYKAIIEPFSAAYGFQMSLIGAIGSRESGWGLLLKPPGPGGTGDHTPRDGKMPPDGLGWGRGLMQLDYAAQLIARNGRWQDPATNIERGIQILHSNFKTSVDRKYVQPLQCAIAAYNCGMGNVAKAIQKTFDIDHFTANKNYSADVLKRQIEFQEAGWQ